MTIKEVSEKYDISEDTLRYYERIGLLPKVPRKKSGIRDFDENSCKWIEFIKCMRSAGMRIEALIEYMNLFQEGKKTVTARKNLLLEQREILEEKRNDITKTIERLDYKISLYNEIEVSKRKDFMEDI